MGKGRKNRKKEEENRSEGRDDWEMRRRGTEDRWERKRSII